MKNQIQYRIMQHRKIVEDCRTIIKGCNDDIEQGSLVLNDLQQAQLDSIADKGRSSLQEVERLNKLLNS